MPCINHPEVAEGVRYCSRCGACVCVDCHVTLRELTLCGACKHEQLLDLASGAPKETTAVFASIGRRWAAMVVDKIIMILLIFAFGIVGTLFDTTGPDHDMTGAATGAILGFVAFVAYETLTTRGRGQTWGKRLLKIRVVATSGNPVSGLQAFGRAIVRTLALSIFALIDYVPAFVTPERTCVHDLIAQTRVVNAE